MRYTPTTAYAPDQIRRKPDSPDSIDLHAIYLVGEWTEQCGDYSRRNPSCPLRDNPYYARAETLEHVAFGEGGAVYFCNDCRAVTPRLDPANGYLTICCLGRITIDWNPDADEDDQTDEEEVTAAMGTHRAFWSAINAQLEELGSARTADDVLRILSHERNPDQAEPRGPGDGFFAGSGGDGSVRSALLVAGWKVTWSEASYYYVMHAPNGSMITYIEGDIYRGDGRPGSSEQKGVSAMSTEPIDPTPADFKRRYPYRVVERIHLKDGETVDRTASHSERPLYAGEMGLAMDRAAWSLSLTPEPDWAEVFAEVDMHEAQAPDDLSSIEEGNEPEPHVPEPTGVMTVHTDDHRHLIIPRESIRYVEVIQFDQDGERVVAKPGWPKKDEQ